MLLLSNVDYNIVDYKKIKIWNALSFFHQLCESFVWIFFKSPVIMLHISLFFTWIKHIHRATKLLKNWYATTTGSRMLLFHTMILKMCSTIFFLSIYVNANKCRLKVYIYLRCITRSLTVRYWFYDFCPPDTFFSAVLQCQLLSTVVFNKLLLPLIFYQLFCSASYSWLLHLIV